MTSKYRNKKTEVNGIKFDSKKEAERYSFLLHWLNVGLITNLKLQPEFTLQEAFKTPEGENVKAIRYRADFSYITKEGKPIVEDVKGVKTDVYKMKYKMMLDRFGITVKEV